MFLLIYVIDRAHILHARYDRKMVALRWILNKDLYIIQTIDLTEPVVLSFGYAADLYDIPFMILL